MSLKLSQYSYKPTYTGYNQLTEERSVAIEPSKFKEGDKPQFYRKDSSPRKFDCSYKSSVAGSGDGSVSPSNKSDDEYPDNLNNRKFKFKLMKG